MSSSPSLESLFAAARDDAPSEDVHDVVWGRIAAATSVPVAASAMAAKATASTKLVAVGAMIGAASAALTAIVLTAPSSTPAPLAAARRTPTPVATMHGARLADPAPRVRATPRRAPVAAETPGQSPAQDRANVSMSEEASSLAEEARLVTSARHALVEGSPERALALVRITRTLPVRALEPEELALEARALRALGRADDALATELILRKRHPSHALAR